MTAPRAVTVTIHAAGVDPRLAVALALRFLPRPAPKPADTPKTKGQ